MNAISAGRSRPAPALTYRSLAPADPINVPAAINAAARRDQFNPAVPASPGPPQPRPAYARHPPGPSAFAVQPSSTASLSALPALNDGAFEAGIETLSPVRGFRPVRALRLLVAPFPRITPTGQSQHLTQASDFAEINEACVEQGYSVATISGLAR